MLPIKLPDFLLLAVATMNLLLVQNSEKFSFTEFCSIMIKITNLMSTFYSGIGSFKDSLSSQ